MTTTDPLDRCDLIDRAHTVCLCDVGGGYLAATAVGPDGEAHLILADRDAIGDEAVRYDATCAAVAHDQEGPLPIEYLRGLVIASRTPRVCGRPTKSGSPCRILTRSGPCGLHRRDVTR
jgi:hypothetical protein